MATHSSVLAWRIPETEEPGGLPPMGSHRVGHNSKEDTMTHMPSGRTDPGSKNAHVSWTVHPQTGTSAQASVKDPAITKPRRDSLDSPRDHLHFGWLSPKESLWE